MAAAFAGDVVATFVDLVPSAAAAVVEYAVAAVDEAFRMASDLVLAVAENLVEGSYRYYGVSLEELTSASVAALEAVR